MSMASANFLSPGIFSTGTAGRLTDCANCRGALTLCNSLWGLPDPGRDRLVAAAPGVVPGAGELAVVLAQGALVVRW